MKLIETPFMVGEDQIGTVKRYADIFPELANPQPRDRVLPAPYFYETRMFFSLIKQREPGEPGWPRGGYEVRDEGGASRCFDLDQVILHPSVIKHRRTLNMMNRSDEKAERKRVNDLERGLKPKKEKVEGTRRGRPALDPEVKAARELEKVARAERSGGRRGRPASELMPNPSNGQAILGYEVSKYGNVSIEIYSQDGSLVRSLLNAPQDQGRYKIAIDMTSEVQGYYSVIIKIDGLTIMRPMIITR